MENSLTNKVKLIVHAVINLMVGTTKVSIMLRRIMPLTENTNQLIVQNVILPH
jgi:hypothetical protein